MIPTVSTAGWCLLVVAAIAVGIAKTALPGAATLAVALFAAVLPARASTGALLILLLVGDVVAIAAYRHDADWATLRRLVPGVVLGLVLGAGFLTLAGDRATAVLIGALLLVLIAVTLTLMRRAGTSVARGRTSQLLYGTLSGFTTMTANAGGPVMTMYLLASRFAVAPFLGTTAWFFFAVNVVKLPLSIGLGVIRVETLRLNAVLAPVVIVSALAGRRLAIRMNQNLFDRLVTALTVVSAGYLIIGAM